MNINRRSQEELITQAEDLALRARSNARHGEAWIIESNALLIQSNARVEGEVKNLKEQIKKFNHEAGKQTGTLIHLTWVIAGLTVLLVVGLVIQIYIS